jgi:hypothetical protein
MPDKGTALCVATIIDLVRRDGRPRKHVAGSRGSSVVTPPIPTRESMPSIRGYYGPEVVYQVQNVFNTAHRSSRATAGFCHTSGSGDGRYESRLRLGSAVRSGAESCASASPHCFIPHSHIASTTGLKLSPKGVKEYSTFGGTWA